MRPLNYKKRKASQLRFLLVFSVTLIVIFCTSLFAFYTGKKGITILEKKHSAYNKIFEKQAFITFKIDEITKYLYSLKNKKRTLGEHKQFQGLISNLIANIEDEIKNTKSSIGYDFKLYNELLIQIKEIQTIVDDYQKESEQYIYNKALLEKCREKYRIDEGKKIKKHEN